MHFRVEAEDFIVLAIVFWAAFGLVASRLYILAIQLFGDGNNCEVDFWDCENGKQILNGTASACRGPAGSFCAFAAGTKCTLREARDMNDQRSGVQMGLLHTYYF
jgi:hypothetical protein